MMMSSPVSGSMVERCRRAMESPAWTWAGLTSIPSMVGSFRRGSIIITVFYARQKTLTTVVVLVWWNSVDAVLDEVVAVCFPLLHGDLGLHLRVSVENAESHESEEDENDGNHNILLGIGFYYNACFLREKKP